MEVEGAARLHRDEGKEARRGVVEGCDDEGALARRLRALRHRVTEAVLALATGGKADPRKVTDLSRQKAAE